MNRRKSSKAKANDWAAKQAQFRERLESRYIGHASAIDLAAGLMATFTSAPVDLETPLPRVMVAGPTSAGKSYLAELMATHLNAPVAFVDASGLTSPGYKGINLGESLAPLLRNRAIREGHKRGLLVLDEFDKLALGANRDHWLKQVEYNLLPILNGDTVQIPDTESFKTIQMSTKNIMVLALGVFDGAQSNKWESPQLAQQQLKKFGFGSELVSRFSHFIGLRKPTSTEFQELIEREAHNLKQHYQLNKWSPTIPPRKLKQIAQSAYRSDFGIRGARVELHANLFALAKSFGEGCPL